MKGGWECLGGLGKVWEGLVCFGRVWDSGELGRVDGSGRVWELKFDVSEAFGACICPYYCHKSFSLDFLRVPHHKRERIQGRMWSLEFPATANF